MKILQMKELLDQGKNLIFYKRDVEGCYNQLKDEYRCVYIDEPLPVSVRLREILVAIAGYKYISLSHKSIAELQKFIIEESQTRTIIILFNWFERLSKRSALQYSFLHEKGNIVFICSFSEYIQDQVGLKKFYHTFELVNKDEYRADVREEEINITYAVYFVMAFLFFIVYLKAASSMYMAGILIGAAWFAFLIFRTMIFVGGRV